MIALKERLIKEKADARDEKSRLENENVNSRILFLMDNNFSKLMYFLSLRQLKKQLNKKILIKKQISNKIN
jgi:hypothetical protein